jgi:predicted nucleic acid-binding protein
MILCDTSGLIALLDRDDINQARVSAYSNEIRAGYADMRIGFVNASLIALAERHRLPRLLTLDRRHLAVVRPRKLELELLP